MKSMKHMVKNIQEVEQLVNIVELLTPSHISNLFHALEQKGHEWAALNTDNRSGCRKTAHLAEKGGEGGCGGGHHHDGGGR